MGSCKVLKFFSCYKMSLEVELEVEVEVPDVEIEIVGGLDAGLEIEADIEVPLVEAEVGGSSQGGSGGLCNLICAIIFLVIFMGDLGAFLYYCFAGSAAFPHIEGQSAALVKTWTLVCLGAAMALWLTVSACCCRCYKKHKNNTNGLVTYNEATSYEMGGCAEVDIEVEVEAPVCEIEVDLEAPEVEFEVEVEIEAPEVEMEVEVEAEVEVEMEVEVECEVEVEAEVEVEVE